MTLRADLKISNHSGGRDEERQLGFFTTCFHKKTERRHKLTSELLQTKALECWRHHHRRPFEADSGKPCVSSARQRTHTFPTNLLPTFISTNRVRPLRAAPRCSIASEQSRCCLLVLELHLPEPCEHAHVCACECDQGVRVCGRLRGREI